MNNLDWKDIKKIMSAYLSGKGGDPSVVPIFACHAHEPLRLDSEGDFPISSILESFSFESSNLEFLTLIFCFVKKIKHQNVIVATVVLDEVSGKYETFEQVEYFPLSDREGCESFLNLPWSFLTKPKHISILSFKEKKQMPLSEFKRTVKTWIKSET